MATRLVTGGRRSDWTGPVVNPPVWRASTHLYENTAALAEGPKVNADGRFHRITGIAQVNEVDAFDNATAHHIKAGDKAGFQSHAALSFASASRESMRPS